MSHLTLSSIGTPVGDFHMIIAEGEAGEEVRVSGFGEVDDLQARLPADLIDVLLEPVDGHPFARHVRDYFWGNLNALDAIPHRQEGTNFNAEVWNTLETIPPGNVLSYGELAAAIKEPTAVSATGVACHKNKLALLVPDHRAVKNDGEVGNYIYGSDMKRFLLQHEANFAPVNWTVQLAV